MPKDRRAIPTRTFAVVFVLGVAINAASAQDSLDIVPVPPGQVRIDGALRDWSGVAFAALGRGTDGAASFALGEDETGLYVAARVHDTQIVHARTIDEHADAVVVTLGAKDARGHYRGVDIWLFPGRVDGPAARGAVVPAGAVPSRAKAMKSSRPVSALRVVEGPLPPGEAGYAIEAFIPWAATFSLASLRESGRVNVRLHDVDSEAGRERILGVAFSPVQAAQLERLPPLLLGDESRLLDSFRTDKQLGSVKARFDRHADVAGDERAERVIVIDRYLMVLGSGYRKGQAYGFLELPVAGADAVRDISFVDLTADAKSEILLTLRQRNVFGERLVLWVVLVKSDSLSVPLRAELEKRAGETVAKGSFRVERPAVRSSRTAGSAVGRRPASLEIRSATSDVPLREQPENDAVPLLLTRSGTVARRFVWNGERFAESAVQAAGQPASTEGSPIRAPEAEAASAAASTDSRSATLPVAGTFNRDRLVDHARRDWRLAPTVKPDRVQHANVAGSKRDEEVFTLGPVLVVVGPEFEGGVRYFAFSLPVADARDVLMMRAIDFNGDGQAEIALHVRRQSPQITRELLLVYRFAADQFTRPLAIEVARVQGPNEIRNQFAFVRKSAEITIQISPGKARGWDATTYPFVEEGGADIRPILLPWRDAPARIRVP